MNNEPVKKINAMYLISYIGIPLLCTALCFWLGYTFFHDGGLGAVVLFLVPPTLSILWWVWGGKLLFKGKRKKLMRELEISNMGSLPFCFSGTHSRIMSSQPAG